MLNSVRFKDFRCFRSVQVRLRPLTILIGPNDSGKSAFLAAIKKLAQLEKLETQDCWRAQPTHPPEVVGETTTGDMIVRYGKRPSSETSNPSPLEPLGFYQLPAHGVVMTSGGYSDTGNPPALQGNGTGVPALLDHLLRSDRERFFAFVEAMRGLVPGFEDIKIATPDAARRRVDLVIDGGFRIEADRTSAGVRLLLFFVALSYHPDPPKLILLEEPENGVHPKRLGDVMRLLREVTQGKHGDHAAQIVLTTHSPHLLDYVDPEQDQVLIFRRTEDGSRTAEPADESRLKSFLDEFKLGEVWFNEDEAGLVERGA